MAAAAAAAEQGKGRDGNSNGSKYVGTARQGKARPVILI